MTLCPYPAILFVYSLPFVHVSNTLFSLQLNAIQSFSNHHSSFRSGDKQKLRWTISLAIGPCSKANHKATRLLCFSVRFFAVSSRLALRGDQRCLVPICLHAVARNHANEKRQPSATAASFSFFSARSRYLGRLEAGSGELGEGYRVNVGGKGLQLKGCRWQCYLACMPARALFVVGKWRPWASPTSPLGVVGSI